MKMILDKLMEEKDLLIYIDYRVKHLREVLHNIKKVHINDRGDFKYRTLGKIIELLKLKKLINEGRLIAAGKSYWREEIKEVTDVKN